MIEFYKLKYRKPVSAGNVYKWSSGFERKNRRVRSTCIGNYHISTIFLGIDHQFRDTDTPLLFETMIFNDGDSSGEYQTRCTTWRQALAMHWEGVEYAKNL